MRRFQVCDESFRPRQILINRDRLSNGFSKTSAAGSWIEFRRSSDRLAIVGSSPLLNEARFAKLARFDDAVTAARQRNLSPDRC